MCDHQMTVLHTDTYSNRISKTETRITKIDILYCEKCEENDTDFEEITVDINDPQPLPDWAKGNHKKIY